MAPEWLAPMILCVQYYCYSESMLFFRQTSALNRIGWIWDGGESIKNLYVIAHAFRMHFTRNFFYKIISAQQLRFGYGYKE